MFEKGEKTTVCLQRRGVYLGIELEERKNVQIKKIHPLSYKEILKLHRYIKQIKARREF